MVVAFRAWFANDRSGASQHFRVHPEGVVGCLGACIAGDEDRTMLTSGQRDQAVIGGAASDATTGEVAMGATCGVGTELKGLWEVLVDQCHRVSGVDASITGQTRQHRVCFGERMPAEPKTSAYRPLRDRDMLRMRGHKQRHGDTGVDRRDPRRCQRRPESMNANIISSVTTVSALATRRPSLLRTSRAERPPGTICKPGPYAEISTVEPGVSPNASRSCLGTKILPPESMTASMGLGYQ